MEAFMALLGILALVVFLVAPIAIWVIVADTRQKMTDLSIKVDATNASVGRQERRINELLVSGVQAESPKEEKPSEEKVPAKVPEPVKEPVKPPAVPRTEPAAEVKQEPVKPAASEEKKAPPARAEEQTSSP